MTPEEEAYEEALRRIREAEETGALKLDLSDLVPLDRLPQELTRLTSLKELRLHACERLIDISPLAGLASLQKLGLTGLVFLTNQLNNISPLANLTSLRVLNLSLCRQLSDISPLAGLTSLQILNLSGLIFDSRGIYQSSQLSDISPLSTLLSLQSLDLSGCGRLSDISPLATLPSLQKLNLAVCEQLNDISPLAGLTSLRELSLSACEQIKDISPLARLGSLQELNLDGCFGIRSFAPLKPLLPTLQKLYLGRCKLEDLPSEVCGELVVQDVLDKQDSASAPRQRTL
jgi:internalin A